LRWSLPLWTVESYALRKACARAGFQSRPLAALFACAGGPATVYIRGMKKKRIAMISTGGTIEKTYNSMTGVLANEVNILDIMLEGLVLHGIDLVRVPLMNKDSSEMTEGDHTLIAETAAAMGMAHDGVVIVHGTDRMEFTGEQCVKRLSPVRVPIVLTGAMQPYELRHTDSVQNLTEALLAVQLLPPGVYLSMHNNVLAFPGVIKDWKHGRFIKGPESA
jgi:L-asparaginase